MKQKIERCHPMCQTCTDTTLQTCTTCIDNASFLNGICQCKDGFYFSLVSFPEDQTFPGRCQMCNPSCKLCQGPSNRDCLECQNGYSLSQEICMYNCDDGQYWDQIQQTCLKCHNCCRTCVAGQNNQCHDCNKGYIFRVLDQSCMVYNLQCQTCTVAINSLCGGTQQSHNECLTNGWVLLDSTICQQCTVFVNNICGGGQSEELTSICKQFGYYNYDNNNCSSCRNVVSHNCGRIEIQNICLNSGWVRKDQNICIYCGKAINGICGGDLEQQDMQFCQQQGFFSFDGQNCSSCIYLISNTCGRNEIKLKCKASGWEMYDTNTCYNCSKLLNGKCGVGQNSSDIIHICQKNGYLESDDISCSSCRNVVSGKCGIDQIQDRCFNDGWDQYDDNLCKDCNINSLEYNQCICHSTCLTCSRFFSSIQCTSCKPTLFFFQGYCLPKCPNGTFINGKNCDTCSDFQIPSCFNCYKTCQICSPFEISLNPQTCIKCSDKTRKLLNGECKCLDPEDNRQIFFECSFQSIAVLNPVLSNIDPKLSIDFGKIINIPENSEFKFPEELCFYLFTSKTRQLFGSTFDCQIQNKYIIVNFGIDSQIFEGDLIYFNNNIISFMSSPDILIQTYMNIIVTQQQLIGDSFVQFNSQTVYNSCEDISITFNQIINHAKRGFKLFKWSLKSFISLDSIYQSILNNVFIKANKEKSLNLQILKGIIKPNTQIILQFSYTLKVNIQKIQEFPLQVKLQKNINIDLKSSIEYPFYRQRHYHQFLYFKKLFKRYKSAMITIQPQILICYASGDQIVNDEYNFTITSEKSPQIVKQIYHESKNIYILEMNDNSKCKILIHQQIKQYLYYISLKIKANLVSDSLVQSQSSLKVQVSQSNLQVKILSESSYFNFRKNIILKSYMRDYELLNENGPQEIKHQWICIDPRKKKNETATIEGSTFDPYTVAQIVLIGEKPIDRKSNDTITITLIELDIPPLEVQIFFSDPIQETVNLNEELYIKLEYSTTVNVDLLSFSAAIQYENEVVALIKIQYTNFRFRIQNYFSNFKQDSSQFQIKFSVYNPQYYMPSITMRSMTINFPPNNCKFTISQSQNVIALETKLLLVLDECQDDNQPIQYQFFYYKNPSDFEYEKKNPNQIKRQQISNKSKYYLYETTLPPGMITILAQAIDSKNAIYNSTIVINVQQKEYDEQLFLSFIQQKLDYVSQIPPENSIYELSVLCNDILQRPQFKQSSLINQKKIEIINQLIQLQKKLSSLSSFSTLIDKSFVSLFESGVTLNQSEQTNFLTYQTKSLDDHSNFKETYKELSIEKFIQKTYDCFQILDNLESPDQSLDKLVELSNKIQSYQFKNILPNEDPVHYQGKQMSNLATQITEKHICKYFICNQQDEQIDDSKQTTIYDFTQSQFNQNPYLNDSNFKKSTNSSVNQTQDLTIKYPLITPSISDYQNTQINSLTNQILLKFPKQQENLDQKKLVCVSKDDISNLWTKSKCKSIYHELSKSYQCVCSKLSSTTIVEDLFEDSNIDVVIGSEGLSNILNFNNFYKYVIFWLLLIQTILFFSLCSVGLLLDRSYLKFKNIQQKNKNCFTTNNYTKYSNSSNKVHPLTQNEDFIIDENKIFTLNKNTVSQFEEKQILTPPQNSSPNSTLNSPRLKNIMKSHINSSNNTQLEIKSTQLSQFNLNINKNRNNTDNISIFENQQLKNTNISSYSDKEIQIQQNLEVQQNQRTTQFLNFSSFKQILIFHNFFGIFYLSNSTLSRPLRFFIFYIRSLHSLCISVIFDQSYSIEQQMIIAIINGISIILIMKILTKIFHFTSKIGKTIKWFFTGGVILGYYYVIFGIVSGQTPEESNQFIQSFSMFYISDIFIVAFISATIQKIITKTLLKNKNIKGIKKFFYKLMELQSILLQIEND